jgi:hypothetical protein
MAIPTREVKILWQGREEMVTIKKFGGWRRDEIFRQASEIKIVGKEQSVTLNPVRYRELLLNYGIIKAPFEIKVETFRDDEFSSEIYDKLINEITEFNSVSPL